MNETRLKYNGYKLFVNNIVVIEDQFAFNGNAVIANAFVGLVGQIEGEFMRKAIVVVLQSHAVINGVNGPMTVTPRRPVGVVPHEIHIAIPDAASETP